jgi:hypothetical protein
MVGDLLHLVNYAFLVLMILESSTLSKALRRSFR